MGGLIYFRSGIFFEYSWRREFEKKIYLFFLLFLRHHGSIPLNAGDSTIFILVQDKPLSRVTRQIISKKRGNKMIIWRNQLTQLTLMQSSLKKFLLFKKNEMRPKNV